MTADEIKRWLCGKLTEVESVRNCARAQDGYLIVTTWTGTLIHVHLFDETPRVRTLKRILGDSSRVGIGVLFLMNANLLPADGEAFEPDEALQALHALFRDKIYTYRQTSTNGSGAATVKIGQLHLKPYGRGVEQEAWYGPDVEIKHLPCYKVWIKQPQSVRGDWLIANFGTEAFWKQADYTAGRAAFRQQTARASGSAQFYKWSNPGWGNPDGMGYRTPVPGAPESELDRSYQLLGLTRAASEEEVKLAFRKLAREFHPDVSALPKDEAEARFKRLYAAYRYIKTATSK